PEPEPDPEPEPEEETDSEPEEDEPEEDEEVEEEDDESDEGPPQEAEVGTESDVSDSFLADVHRTLQAEQRYPRAAERRRLEGSVGLTFVLDAEGNVLEWEIAEPSEHELFDEEVERMIEAVQMPEIPEDESFERLELSVTIEFRLR
ncbi:MAG: energy transducer TonB, partial [Halorhodospira sp.]